MSAVERLELRHPGGVTPIAVGRGALDACRGELESALAGCTVFAVTTPRVLGLHRAALDPLAAAARGWRVLEVPEGEAAKTVECAAGLWRDMLAAGGKRDSAVVAFGGGSVGDLAGFAAGAFLRGIEWLQIPTTLVAQLDAAIGGKTGVDLPRGKNAVGLFHHPRQVVCDTDLLATLPRGELRSGLVEAVKAGILGSLELFDRIEDDLPALLAAEPAALAPVVAGAARVKVGIVAADPGESGPRQALNLGHTLGHALEEAAGYGGLRHGEAVAWGLLFAFRLAEARGLAPEAGDRVRRLLSRFGLPTLRGAEPRALVELIRADKKAREAGVTWVLPRGLGRAPELVVLAEEEVAEHLARFLERPG